MLLQFIIMPEGSTTSKPQLLPNAKALAAPLGACGMGLAAAHTPPTKPNCVRPTAIGVEQLHDVENPSALRECGNWRKAVAVWLGKSRPG